MNIRQIAFFLLFKPEESVIIHDELIYVGGNQLDSKQIIGVTPGRMIGSIVLALILGLLLPLIAVLQISLLLPVLMLCGIVGAHLKARAGWLPAMVLFAASLGSTLWFVGAPAMFMLLLAAVLPALLITRSMAQKQPFFEQLKLGIAAYVLGLVAAMIAAYMSFGSGMIASFVDVLRAEFDRMPDAALQPFADAVNSTLALNGIRSVETVTVEMYRAQLKGVLDLMQQTYARMLPGTLLTGAMLSGVLTVLWGNWTMARLGLATNESFMGMSRWFLPAQATVGALALWAVSLIIANSGYEAGATVHAAVGELAGSIFVIQALSALDRRMLTAGRSLSRRRTLIALLAIGALIFGGVAMVLCLTGVLSALFGSRGAVTLWRRERENDHSDRDDPEE